MRVEEHGAGSGLSSLSWRGGEEIDRSPLPLPCTSWSALSNLLPFQLSLGKPQPTVVSPSFIPTPFMQTPPELGGGLGLGERGYR